MSRYLKGVRRPSRPRKRHFQGNQFTIIEEESAEQGCRGANDARKFTSSEDVRYTPLHAYRVVEFSTVFLALSDLLLCKACQKPVKFEDVAHRGLGFKIQLNCRCGQREVNSGPMIRNGYEINRRIVLVMRLLGIGRNGINIFCNLMDICNGLTECSYNMIVEHVYEATRTVFRFICKKAIEEEKYLNMENETMPENLKVSGDCSWKKLGFQSLYGVTTFIGHYSGKVIDLVVKSSCCQACSAWKNKTRTKEYRQWFEKHQGSCASNHEGSVGKIEVDSIKEMFLESEDRYGVRYENLLLSPALRKNLAKFLLPMDEDLSREDLLRRCLDDPNQNANEDFNSTVWIMAPEHLRSGLKIVEIASFLAAGLFNEGYNSILRIMSELEIHIGIRCEMFAETSDSHGIHKQIRLSLSESKNARLARKEESLQENLAFDEAEGLLYPPDIPY